MKDINLKIKSKVFQIKTEKKRLEQINILLENFSNLQYRLKEEIKKEEQRYNINDKAHFAYSTITTSYYSRCEKLQQSIKKLLEEKQIASNKLYIFEEELTNMHKLAMQIIRSA